ncbi:DUF4174 domain-containing protein [Jannaschia sp. 2305UL9-9]|uniref:DUF4174 domain-containing protein n=1 Tax=Jannaschia sp. 2305UL9-9 TaxID=3121638 RepID=UPI0035286E15
MHQRPAHVLTTAVSKASAMVLGCALMTFPASAAEVESTLEAWAADPARIFTAEEVDIDALEWVARPVVVFANSPRDPAFIEQMEEIVKEMDRLVERDVIVVVDTDRDSGSDLRTRLRPRSFMLVLIGKDGEVKLRKPLPWTVRELSRSIDKMPMRRRELREE